MSFEEVLKFVEKKESGKRSASLHDSELVLVNTGETNVTNLKMDLVHVATVAKKDTAITPP